MNDNSKTGLLLNANDIKISRQYFREMVKLIGIRVLYRSPKSNKHYTTYAEIDSNYNPPILVGCVFHSHPDQQTLRKIGWVSELQESSSIIEVDYDLPELQQGSLFIVPGGIDNSKGRLFRVVKIYNSMVYPASVACEIVPEYEDTIVREAVHDYSTTSYNLVEEQYEEFSPVR